MIRSVHSMALGLTNIARSADCKASIIRLDKSSSFLGTIVSKGKEIILGESSFVMPLLIKPVCSASDNCRPCPLGRVITIVLPLMSLCAIENYWGKPLGNKLAAPWAIKSCATEKPKASASSKLATVPCAVARQNALPSTLATKDRILICS